jgi:D-allulose-6-phosphate 3-epimerase
MSHYLCIYSKFRWKKNYGYTYKIQVDGSCSRKTFKKLYDAGTEIFVVGNSGLFSLNEDLAMAYDEMLVQFESALR